jgi:hypothetical protein
MGDAPSGGGTAMARLAQLINLIGAASPSSGAETNIFQFLWQLNNYLSGGAAIPGLGQQSDTASASGAANAKLAYLIANLVTSGVTIGRTFTPGSFSTTSSTLQQALSITGKGTLVGLTLYVPNSFTSGEIKITLNGVVVLDNTTITANSRYFLGIMETGLILYSQSSGLIPTLASIDFKSSLLIQIASDGTRTMQIGWGYNQ